MSKTHNRITNKEMNMINDEVSNFQFERFRKKYEIDENVSTSNWQDFYHVSESIQSELNEVRKKIKEMENA
tara:strand:+ start:366 stop:578 length:213 start_codon:yes stop_codon:yes gene_type:complete